MADEPMNSSRRTQERRSPITDQQLNDYEALAAAATPAPWSLWRQGQPAEVIDTEEQSIGRIWQREDAEFIVATRTAAPALVVELRTLRSLVRDFLDPDPCRLDHHGYCQTHGWLAKGPCPHATARQILGSLESTPSEQEAAATLARECTDHAAVILWCADRVRSVDDDPAVQDAADYLHDLSTRAQVDTTPISNRLAIIRWCAQQIHSMGGDADVERAAEYLDGLAVEAQEVRDEAEAQAHLDVLTPIADGAQLPALDGAALYEKLIAMVSGPLPWPPPDNRPTLATLRERIAQDLYCHDHPGWTVPLWESDAEPVYRERAVAILAGLRDMFAAAGMERRRCGYTKRHPSHTFMRLEVLFQCPGEHGTERER